MSQLKKYKRVKYLGKGSYGAAILAELRSNPAQKFVIKEIVIGHLKLAEQNAAKSEADVLHQMNHSNITMYIESFVENDKLYIVMEHADGGDLSTAIQSRRKDAKYWDEEEVMRIFVQICLALKHVHNANILHRDLKSQNIFLTLKGMIKLGDFGIAKVLDATDDQARTQIGTPYYLSPEICESRPYGRESDIWSLGVLLYEIVALEMPFQATSLPALVHRICSAEPNYSTVERRYSVGLIMLIKCMLEKDPHKRPSVGQIVKTDFIKTHISKLLSYTIKVGNGGVQSNQPPQQLLPRERPLTPKREVNSQSTDGTAHGAGAAKDGAAKDGDDDDDDYAERQLESVHNYHREQESKVVQSQQSNSSSTSSSSKEANRVAEREKLRKFRQEQMNKLKKDNSDREGEDTVVVVLDDNNNNNNNNGRNPFRAAPKVIPNQPTGVVNRANAGGRALSPINANANNNNNAIANNNRGNISPKMRPLSPKSNNNNRPLSPKNSNSNNNYRVVSPKGNQRVVSSSSVAVAPLTPRSLAEHQAMREQERKQQQFFDRQAAAGVKYQQPPPQQQQQQQQQQVVAVANSNNNYRGAAVVMQSNNNNNNNNNVNMKPTSDYDSAARREYFNNRAAAQAVKAKVEAYERHGGIIDRFNHGGAVVPGEGGGGLGGGGGGGALMVPVLAVHPSPLVRRNSDSSSREQQQIYNNVPMSDDYYNVKGGRRSYEGDIDPEARIALIKLQKERERDRENALKEIELKEALEANREARRKSQQHKAAIAFEIDLSTGSPLPSSSSVSVSVAAAAPRITKSVSNSNIHEVRRSRGDAEENNSSNSNNSNNSSNNNGGGGGMPIIVNNHQNAAIVGKSRHDSSSILSSTPSPSIASSSSSSVHSKGGSGGGSGGGGSEVDLSLGSVRSSKNRKGWGPPIVPGDAAEGGLQIAKGVVRYSEYASRAAADRVDQMFVPDDGFGGGGRRKSIDKSDDGSMGYNGGSYDRYDNIQQQEVSEGHSQKDVSVLDDLTTANDEVEGEGEGQLLVMRRLESKRNSQLQARQQAKEIFKKLREKKRHESEVKKSPSADTKVKNIYPVVSPVKHLPLESNSTHTPPPTTTTTTTSSNAGGPPSMQARLMAIMSQVEIANESVQKAVSAGALGQVMSTNMNNNAAAAADGRNTSMLDRLKNEAESKHMSRMNGKATDGERGGDVKSSVMIDNRNGKGYIATPQDDKHSDGYDYGRDGDDHDAIIDESIDHADTDLEDTLSNWLIQQRRGVTKRKKHLAREVHSNLEAALNISCEDAETVEEEEGMQGYQTQTKPMMVMRLQGDRERGGGDGDTGGDDAVGDDPMIEDEEINSSKYLSNGDNDVVDLQCMLAQALMAEDDED